MDGQCPWSLMCVALPSCRDPDLTRIQYTPAPLVDAELVDPDVTITPGANYTFTLSARGGVAPYAWIDHPSGTVGYFVDATTNTPLNGFYLVPGIDRSGKSLPFSVSPCMVGC